MIYQYVGSDSDELQPNEVYSEVPGLRDSRNLKALKVVGEHTVIELRQDEFEELLDERNLITV